MGCGRITCTALMLTAAMLGAGSIAPAQEVQTGAGTNELSFLAADTDGDRLIDEAELGATRPSGSPRSMRTTTATSGRELSTPDGHVRRRDGIATAGCRSSR